MLTLQRGQRFASLDKESDRVGDVVAQIAQLFEPIFSSAKGGAW